MPGPPETTNLIGQAIQHVDLNFNTIVNGVILLFIGAGVRRLTAISAHLGKINGHIAEELQWRKDHNGAHLVEADHHEETRRQCRLLQQERIQNIAQRIDDLRRSLDDRRE